MYPFKKNACEDLQNDNQSLISAHFSSITVSVSFFPSPFQFVSVDTMPLEKESSFDVSWAARGRHVSWCRQILNLLCCALSLPVYFILTVSTHYPITLDLLMTIILAELNRFFNERRRQKFYDMEVDEQGQLPDENDLKKRDLELQTAPPRVDCMAAVVGWREDPALFARAMESYKSALGCVFLLVGIDGDEPEDQEMARVFHEACVFK